MFRVLLHTFKCMQKYDKILQYENNNTCLDVRNKNISCFIFFVMIISLYIT